MKTAGMLVLTALLMLSLTSCIPPSVIKKNSEGAIEPTVLKSTDGQSQITIPKGWKEDKTLDEEAALQASDAANEMYTVVYNESKEDFDQMTVDKYSELTRASILEAMKSPQLSNPSKFTINGHPALQYEIRGTVDNIKVAYLHVIVEGPQRFHQILAWTLNSQFEKNRSQLESVIASFKETGSSDQSN